MLGEGVGVEDRDNLVLALTVDAVELDDRVLLVVFQAGIALEDVEHLAVGAGCCGHR